MWRRWRNNKRYRKTILRFRNIKRFLKNKDKEFISNYNFYIDKNNNLNNSLNPFIEVLIYLSKENILKSKDLLYQIKTNNHSNKNIEGYLDKNTKFFIYSIVKIIDNNDIYLNKDSIKRYKKENPNNYWNSLITALGIQFYQMTKNNIAVKSVHVINYCLKHWKILKIINVEN